MTDELNKSPPAHTALPWLYDSQTAEIYIADDEHEPCDVIADMEVLKTPSDHANANGEFIVLACNSHYEFLEALEGIIGDAPDIEGGICRHCGRDYLGVDEDAILSGNCPADDCPGFLGRAALAKVRGQK